MDFTFEDQRARDHARLIHALSRDLASIEELTAPSIRDIASAPLLENWVVGRRFEPALVGVVTGHPLILDGPVSTSSLHYLDTKAGYARTLTRWYRLGSPMG